MSVQELIEHLCYIAKVSPDYEVVIEPYMETVQWNGCGEGDCDGGEEPISNMRPIDVIKNYQNKTVVITTEETK